MYLILLVTSLMSKNEALKNLIRSMREAVEVESTIADDSTVDMGPADIKSLPTPVHPPESLKQCVILVQDLLTMFTKYRRNAQLEQLIKEQTRLIAHSNLLQAELRRNQLRPRADQSTQTRSAAPQPAVLSMHPHNFRKESNEPLLIISDLKKNNLPARPAVSKGKSTKLPMTSRSVPRNWNIQRDIE
jgi:hypothetical protein